MVKRREPENPASGDSKTQIRRGDIFWADFPDTGGSVKKAIRPALVVQNNTGNRFGPLIIVCPLTSKLSMKSYPVNVETPAGLLSKPSEIRINQIITIDKSRLGMRIAHLPPESMFRVDEALRVSLGLPRVE